MVLGMNAVGPRATICVSLDFLTVKTPAFGDAGSLLTKTIE